MHPNDSNHLLSINSMIFTSTANLNHPLPTTNPTLVDLREAADTNVTALPAPLPSREKKPSVWRRVLAKIKGAFGGKKKKKKKKMNIGGPTGFQHQGTEGVMGLRGADGECGGE
jgi:hypothetical protein